MNPTLFIFVNLALLTVVLVVFVSMPSPQTQIVEAVSDNKDFYLIAYNEESGETVEDFADTKQTCKSLEEFYESQGYAIIQKCHPGPNSG